MPGMNAARVRFDAPSQHRRAMVAKVHLAKKELGLTDDDYRGVLLDVAGVDSCAAMDERQLVQVLDRFKARGFQARPRKAASRAADHPTARKARALWISLHQLGAIENPAEGALEAFAARQLKVERLQWADQRQGYKLVEALKAIAERHGWDQSLEHVSKANAVRVLKYRLCTAILARLKEKGLAGADWSLDEAAFRLLGEAGGDGRPFELGELDVIARGFAAKLRGERA